MKSPANFEFETDMLTLNVQNMISLCFVECFYASGSLERVLETALEAIEQFDMMADGASEGNGKGKDRFIRLLSGATSTTSAILRSYNSCFHLQYVQQRKVKDGMINNLMSFWEGVIGC